jgi:hypothetical protein
MLASELIAKLTQIVQDEGDVEVRDEEGYDLDDPTPDEDTESGEKIVTLTRL